MRGVANATGLLLLLTVEMAVAAAPPPVSDRTAEEFFEKQIRPVLAEHCFACHGPAKQRAGLRLDSAEAMRTGGENGAAIVPGEPDKSLLIQAVRQSGLLKMPPKKKLPDRSIEALATWVKMGAPWPKNTVRVKTPEEELEAARKHWAFQPVRKPAVPSVKQSDRVATPVDAFILQRLETAGLTIAPPAERRTLLRRVTFDLHGLPPTPDEIAAFEADDSPQAFARVVDRLLSSPRYGERWGRHWLDVARYADTKGYVRLNENPKYPTAWTYRDYVIRASNEDLPYNRFLLEQLAADQLDLGEDKRPLAAMGFLTLGERFINSRHDILDDRIDVVTRGLLGLTVSCARCHDHKFDPIPTRDYYSLHGVFANSLEPRVPPAIVSPGERQRYDTYLKGLQERTAKFDQFLQTQYAKLTAGFRARAGEYLLAAQKEQVQSNFIAVMFLVDAAKDLNPVTVQRWGRLLAESRKQIHPVLTAWHDLAALKPEEFSSKLPDLLAQWKSQAKVNSLVVAALSRDPQPRNLVEAAARFGELFQSADQQWQSLIKKEPSAKKLNDPAWEEIRTLLYGPAAPCDFSLDDIEDYFYVDTALQNQFHNQQRALEDWIAAPGAAPHALVVEDARTLSPARVLLRGNASNPGDVVPRQFLAILSAKERQPFQHGSGRLELARAIADQNNPLTARVLVNRVWMHHFGSGIVRTPSDFGLRGEPPTHPELLDYLASHFVENGWSIKDLHRLILLSSVYQQSSADNDLGRAKDPENLLLWHMNRRRLDWESLRDALLAVSGSLDLSPGGPAVDLFKQPFTTRRTVYGSIDRLNLPGVLRTFDFAGPDASSPMRHQTTVPQQALFLMNSQFPREQARRLAARPDLASLPKPEQRIAMLYRLLYGRNPEPDEVSLALQFLEKEGQPKGLTAWEQYVQALLLANEFCFVD